MTSNLDRWFFYTDGLPTPDNMRLFAWSSLVASCLQRRVWLPPDHKRIYASNYTVMVSEPGIGKSLIIDEVKQLVRFWKRDDNAALIDAKFKDPNLKLVASVDKEANADKEDKGKKTPKQDEEIIKPELFPVAADASTYEALVLAFGKCYRRIQFATKDSNGKEGIGTHGHASLCFLLEELGSLLRKRTEDTVTFLLGLYDCPEDYVYDTVSREKDRIRRGCLNILAGTNPSFMNEIFEKKLINTAFLSRVLFIFATKNRKPVSLIPELTPEQVAARQAIRHHILNLSTLYGPVSVAPETDEWIHNWFSVHEEHPECRSSRNPKLIHYYSRKLIHMKKLAMSLHFGESTDMIIPLSTFQRAVDILDKEEKSMHLALLMDARNDQAKMVKKIPELLQTKPMNFVDIAFEIYQSIGMVENRLLQEALEFLVDANQIKRDMVKDEQLGTDIQIWRLR